MLSFKFSLKFILALTVISLLFIYSCKKITEPNNDSDNDGIEDKIDNCIDTHNPDQIDTDGDGIGDECDPDNNDGPLGDSDEDGVYNRDDNCPEVYNPNQEDDDNDGIGNYCDSDWVDPNGDLDGDGIINNIDNCIDTYNPNQEDGDGDNVGNACDSNLQDGPTGDLDGDGIPNNVDSCPNDYNKGTDYDNDGIDDACDPPPPEYALTLGLYDNFDGMGCEQTYDGSQMAIAGSLSSAIWRNDGNIGEVYTTDISDIVGDSVSTGANPGGYVAKLVNSSDQAIRFVLNNPENIDPEKYLSISSDMLISSETTSEDFAFNIDFHTSFPDQGGGSWYSQISLQKDGSNGKYYISWRWTNRNTNEKYSNRMETKIIDVWYNLRMDIVKVGEDGLKLEWYLNGNKIDEAVPNADDVARLLDPNNLGFGPKRNFEIDIKDVGNNKKLVVFTDNVKAVYTNRTQ